MKALTLAPNDPITWHRLGLLDFTAGRNTQALERIRKAIALDPSLPEQSRSLAEVLLVLGTRDEAHAALREALRIDPYDDAAWHLLARVLTERNETAEAIYSFEKAIHLNGRAATYFYDYALTLARLNRPGVFVNGGTILPGCFRNKNVDVVYLFQAVGKHAIGEMNDNDLAEI